MKKRMSYMLVLMEYVFGCLASLILGLVAGNGLLYGVKKYFIISIRNSLKCRKLELTYIRTPVISALVLWQEYL